MVLNNECPQQAQARPVLKVARGANVRADRRNGFAITNVTVVRETAKAINAHWADDVVDHWLARSQLLAGTTVRRVGDPRVVIVPKWLAVRAKLIPTEARTDG